MKSFNEISSLGKTVVLKDGTVGVVVEIKGDCVVVELHDENGNSIRKEGIVAYEL